MEAWSSKYNVFNLRQNDCNAHRILNKCAQYSLNINSCNKSGGFDGDVSGLLSLHHC